MEGFDRFRPVPDEKVHDKGKAQRNEDERRQTDDELCAIPTRIRSPAGIYHDKTLQVLSVTG